MIRWLHNVKTTWLRRLLAILLTPVVVLIMLVATAVAIGVGVLLAMLELMFKMTWDILKAFWTYGLLGLWMSLRAVWK